MTIYRFLITLCLYFTVSISQSQDYLWPTDASNAMTSSFAESRPGRFHAGIDVKTWGQEGFKIFAIRAGHVSRIRVSPYGYGRAIYLTLDTGETVVYGHLQKFNDEIEKYVWTEQQKRGVYSVQLYPSSSQFTYEQGEQLGYTGQTGIGYPHLHFEMRDVAGRPINPFLKGYKINDNVRPTVSRISVTPMDAFSTVNNDWRPITLVPTYMGSGKYKVVHPIKVTGRVALGASAYDRMNEITNKFGTYINRLVVNEKMVFETTYNKYGYDQNYHARLDRDFRYLSRGKGYFYNLFRDEGNKLPFYNSESTFAGILDFGDLYVEKGPTTLSVFSNGLASKNSNVMTTLGKGSHSFKIELLDYWGNSAEITGFLQNDSSISKRLVQETLIETNNSEIDISQIKLSTEFYDRYLRLQFQFPQSAGLPKVFGVHDDGIKKQMKLLPKSNGKYVTAWSLKNSNSGPLTIEFLYPDQNPIRKWVFYKTVRKGSRKALFTQDGQCKIDFSTNSLFKDMFVRTEFEAPDTTLGYDFASNWYNIGPWDVPLNKGAAVSITYPENDPAPGQLAVYYRGGSKHWVFLGNKNQRQTKTGTVSSFGTYALIRDSQKPYIKYLSPGNNARLSSATPMLKAVFRDNLSGISGEENMKMKLDGQKVIAEYDPEKMLLFYAVRDTLEKGQHNLNLTVRDRCGNAKSLEHTFWVN
jgi:hypothetical protein